MMSQCVDTSFVLSSVLRACVRACADDDDEIILGIIALVVVKAE